MEEIFYIYIVLALLFFLNFFSLIFIFKTKKRLDAILQGGEKNLEESLVNQIKKIEKQEDKIAEILKQLAGLDKISQKSIQKIGMVRFNPFMEAGGDQSFSIALLDLANSGFVITSHYGKEFSRIYAKPIEVGKSQYLLSKEEQEAIEKAIV